MGLSNQSTGAAVLQSEFKIERNHSGERIIALAGNPNVGKSTVFNSLTGLNQHTGNWPGKTVTNAQGRYKYKDNTFILADVPGMYSLMANSEEEEVARNFICFGDSDAVVVVTDATCLERNLYLVLQILEVTTNVVVCVNLMDEAKRKHIYVDLNELSRLLGVAVIGTSASTGKGLDELMEAVLQVTVRRNDSAHLEISYDEVIEKCIDIIESGVKELPHKALNSRWISLKLLDGDEKLLKSLEKYLELDLLKNQALFQKLEEAKRLLTFNGINYETFREMIASKSVSLAEDIASTSIRIENEEYNDLDRKIDSIVTSRRFGIPIMIGLLGLIFWLTITGANYPSQAIASFLFWVEGQLTGLFMQLSAPAWVHSLFVTGVYRTLAWVVSVMLPPMAIFFPLFTLLEDLGYLPRVAFNLDNFFKKSCAHGKQALTMCMGFGCNAAAIIGCRIINSPREKLIAMITNNFVPCNGRFPQPHKEQQNYSLQLTY